MSTDEPTLEEQLDDAHETAKYWRLAHDTQLAHTVAARAQVKAAERKAQLLQAKLDGAAMADGTVVGDLVNDALGLLAQWCNAVQLAADSNDLVVHNMPQARFVRAETRKLLTTPRMPK